VDVSRWRLKGRSKISPSEHTAAVASFKRAHELYHEEFVMAFLAFDIAMVESDWFDRVLHWEQVMESGDIGAALVAWYRARERKMDDANSIQSRPN
jgi:hypothetical protein